MSPPRTPSTRFTALAVALCFSCAAGPAEAPDAGAPDAGVEVGTPDVAAPDRATDTTEVSRGPYPAFKPDIGQIITAGGPVLSAAKLVTIFWADDPNAAALREFGQKLGSSKYWSLLKEYGVGPAENTAKDQVVITTAAPTSWADTDMQSWMTAQLEDPSSGWPAPDSETVYLIVTPPSTQVTSNGSNACEAGGGTANWLTVGDNPYVLFAAEYGSCNWSGSVQDSDTAGAALFVVWDVTDPLGPGQAAWGGYDNDHYAWELFVQGGDAVPFACVGYVDAYFRALPDLPYAVTRFWSNTSATAGHSPCVPAEPGPYYNATPLDMSFIDVNVGWLGLAPAEVHTKGYRVAPGKTGTFRIGLYSDAPTEAWSVQVVEGDGQTAPANPVLALSTDKGAGSNGDIVEVTVKVGAVPSGTTGVLMTVVSTQNQLSHYVPVVIGTY